LLLPAYYYLHACRHATILRRYMPLFFFLIYSFSIITLPRLLPMFMSMMLMMIIIRHADRPRHFIYYVTFIIRLLFTMLDIIFLLRQMPRCHYYFGVTPRELLMLIFFITPYCRLIARLFMPQDDICERCR